MFSLATLRGGGVMKGGGGEGGAIFVFNNLSLRCHRLFSLHRPLLLSEVHPTKSVNNHFPRIWKSNVDPGISSQLVQRE